MRIAAMLFYVLAGLGTMSAIRVVLKGPPPNAPPGYFPGMIVGAFMVPLILFGIGVALSKVGESKPKKRKRKKKRPVVSE
jgi:hypothetical protein